MKLTKKTLPASLESKCRSQWLCDDIRFLDVCSVLEHVFPNFWELGFDERPSYDTQCRVVKAFCENHGAHYYASDREDFSWSEAAADAKKKGLNLVVYEDLS